MNIVDALSMELQHEAASTRKALERAPQDKFAWKPHDKSMTLGILATHLVEIPGWTDIMLNHDDMDMNPAEYKPPLAKSTAELLEMHDTNVAKAIKILQAGVSNEHMMKTWTFKLNGQVVFAMPRAMVMRSWVLNHIVHHRGQLTVYLRLLNIPVPSIYGPSADEQG